MPLKEPGHQRKQGDCSLASYVKRLAPDPVACEKQVASKDYETEMEAVVFAAKKVWSNLRRLWANSPQGSRDGRLQKLKDMMIKDEEAPERDVAS